MSAHLIVGFSVVATLLALPGSASAQTSTAVSASAPISATVLNPCTNQYVTLSGSALFSVTEAVAGTGELKARFAVVLRATGTVAGDTSATYSFSESENVSVFAAAPQALEIGFLSKMNTRGATLTDRWRVRMQLRVGVNAAGQITATSTNAAATVCAG